VHGKWLECVHQNSSASSASSLNSLANYYSTSSVKIDPNINQSVFYDDNSFYKPGYVREAIQFIKKSRQQFFEYQVILKAALNVDRQDEIYEKKKEIQDTEEGPEWIKELNKLVSSVDGKITQKLNKNIFF
jgi:hypothetical protein